MKRKICDNCRVIFIPEFAEQNTCYKCLLEKKERKIKDEYLEMRKQLFGANITERECIVCSKKYKNDNRKPRKTCSATCETSIRMARCGKQKIKQKKTSIEKSNERWLNNEKSDYHPLPLDVQNEMLERKRIWDDKGWEHYLKGRKWNRM